MSYAKIRPRRGTADEWSIENPILYEGELVVEHPSTGVGTGLCRFKIGDGITPYRELPYAFDGAAANAINGGDINSFHMIQLRSGTAKEWEAANPVLGKNEIAYDSTNYSIKIGDGVKKWKELKFINSEDTFIDSDYGDEDASVGTLNIPEYPRDYDSADSQPVATLADVLNDTSVEDESFEESTSEEVVEEPDEKSTVEDIEDEEYGEEN